MELNFGFKVITLVNISWDLMAMHVINDHVKFFKKSNRWGYSEHLKSKSLLDWAAVAPQLKAEASAWRSYAAQLFQFSLGHRPFLPPTFLPHYAMLARY